MAQQLHVVVALERNARTNSLGKLTSIYHDIQRTDVFTGRHRIYTPFAESQSDKDELLENKLPALTALEVLAKVRGLLEKPWDLGATRDASNMTATAPIVVGGETLVPDVPVVTLLTLEQELTKLRTALQPLPVLSATEEWQPRERYQIAVSKKLRNRKVMKSLVLVEATKEHPAQAQPYSEDEPCGTITTTEFSGAIDRAEKERLMDRINTLIEAVKAARAVANQTPVKELKLADKLLSYVFTG